MRRADPALPLVLAAGAVGAGLLGTWVLDDAGISMAYALSLADGHGLLAQPGGSAAEGYSNPLWVLLLSAPLALFGAPVATAKALGAITWVATLLLWARVLGPASQGARVAGLALLALHPAVLVWAFSGMENGLTALLCVALVASWQQAGQGTRGAAGAGLFCALLAWTRPEAALIGLLAPLGHLARREGAGRWQRLGAAWGAWGLGVAALAAHRVAVFGELVPLPWVAKGGGLAARLAERLRDPVLDSIYFAGLLLPGPTLLAGVDGLQLLLGLCAVAITLMVAVGLARSGHATVKDPTRSWCLPLAAGAAWLAYAVMPPDGFGPFRYTTAPVVLTLGWICTHARLDPPWPAILAILGLGQGIGLAAQTAHDPPVPLQRVADDIVALGVLDEDLGVRSVATPDVGAALLLSTRCIRDLGLLTDAPLAHADREDRLADELLGTARPDLIAIHQEWTARARLDADPRFASDYVAVEAWEDAWASDRAGVPLRSGVFLRAELATPERLARLRAGREARSSWPRPAWDLPPLPAIPQDRGCPGAP